MSRVNFGAKPNMYPLPVLIIATYDKDGNPDAMNAAWGVVTDFNEISISMGDHKTTDNLAATGAFTVSMATEDTVVGCDYVGIESGRKVPDKFARAGFHATKSEFVNAPLIDELPMALECKVKSFDNGILVGEIVNVCADESVLTADRGRKRTFHHHCDGNPASWKCKISPWMHWHQPRLPRKTGILGERS